MKQKRYQFHHIEKELSESVKKESEFPQFIDQSCSNSVDQTEIFWWNTTVFFDFDPTIREPF